MAKETKATKETKASVKKKTTVVKKANTKVDASKKEAVVKKDVKKKVTLKKKEVAKPVATKKDVEKVPVQKKAIQRMKVKPDALNAIGRRKESIAKVWVFKGTGEVKLNHQDPLDYLNSPRLVRSMMTPVIELNLENKYDIRIDVSGGGLTGQAEASRLALSRALLEINDDFKPTLKALGLLTQDSREKERKKYGKRGARKSPQFRKR